MHTLQHYLASPIQAERLAATSLPRISTPCGVSSKFLTHIPLPQQDNSFPQWNGHAAPLCTVTMQDGLIHPPSFSQNPLNEIPAQVPFPFCIFRSGTSFFALRLCMVKAKTPAFLWVPSISSFLGSWKRFCSYHHSLEYSRILENSCRCLCGTQHWGFSV